MKPIPPFQKLKKKHFFFGKLLPFIMPTIASGLILILIKFDQIQLKLNDNFMYVLNLMGYKFVYKQYFDVLLTESEVLRL